MTDFVCKQQFMSCDALSNPTRVIEKKICDEVTAQAQFAKDHEEIVH